MMKAIGQVMVWAVTLVVVCVVGVYIQHTFFPPKGIITLDGYPHAVALCETQYKGVVYTKDAVLKAMPTYWLTINRGHENDDEVRRLMGLAHRECAKLNNN